MANKDQLIVIAGGGGFIGGYLAAYFLSRGFRVRCADIKPLDEWYQVHRGAENHGGPVNGDCRDFRVCRAICKGANEVYQLAADMGGMGFIENNKALCMLSVLTNTHMILAAQEAGVDRFFYSSSACVYNADKQKDPNIVALKEVDAYPALPEDGYGWEKLFSERMCRHFREDFGLNTRVARFHNVYGPFGTWEGGREKAPAAICRKVIAAKVSGKHEIEIWGDGTQTRSFMYVDDCVNGINRITHSDILEPVNLGSSELVSINQLVDIAEEIAGITLKRSYKLDAPRGVAGRNSDNSKIANYLGWEPDTRLKDGMEKTYRWIYDEFIAKYDGSNAAKAQGSTFTHGAKPLPGDGYNVESRFMDTWRQGIPAGYNLAGASSTKSAKAAPKAKKSAKPAAKKVASSRTSKPAAKAKSAAKAKAGGKSKSARTPAKSGGKKTMAKRR
ncbi:MAG: NAD-dependent epimerase/dehydratase family protein [Pyrinomonadaceae bacterium]|nr:NAD-dependent epimerase/dehydratase family protein [Phycisphaerales bacterium]